MDRKEILEKIKSIVQENMTINNGSVITESSSLSNDLNFDEIDLAEFLFEIDDVFLVETDLNFEKFTTMKTVIDFIETNSKLPSNPVPVKENPMMKRKQWKEFRDSGLLLFINQFLHIFGWAIVFNFDDEKDKDCISEPIEVYPARVKFRGFDEKSTNKAYQNISKYMKDNSEELLKETEQ